WKVPGGWARDEGNGRWLGTRASLLSRNVLATPDMSLESELRHGHVHARRRLELRRRVRFSPRDLQESAGGHRREEISRGDNAVRAHERYSHFIATDRDRETIPEGPRLLNVGLRDVRDDVAETVVRDDDAFKASLPFLRHPEVQVDE